MENNQQVNPWSPVTDPLTLKILGKLLEELGECSSAVSRCLIQGPDEANPETGKVNSQWVAEEIADVMAGIELTTELFSIDSGFIWQRMHEKLQGLRQWHGMA